MSQSFASKHNFILYIKKKILTKIYIIARNDCIVRRCKKQLVCFYVSDIHKHCVDWFYHMYICYFSCRESLPYENLTDEYMTQFIPQNIIKHEKWNQKQKEKYFAIKTKKLKDLYNEFKKVISEIQ